MEVQSLPTKRKSMSHGAEPEIDLFREKDFASNSIGALKDKFEKSSNLKRSCGSSYKLRRKDRAIRSTIIGCEFTMPPADEKLKYRTNSEESEVFLPKTNFQELVSKFEFHRNGQEKPRKRARLPSARITEGFPKIVESISSEHKVSKIPDVGEVKSDVNKIIKVPSSVKDMKQRFENLAKYKSASSTKIPQPSFKSSARYVMSASTPAQIVPDKRQEFPDASIHASLNGVGRPLTTKIVPRSSECSDNKSCPSNRSPESKVLEICKQFSSKIPSRSNSEIGINGNFELITKNYAYNSMDNGFTSSKNKEVCHEVIRDMDLDDTDHPTEDSTLSLSQSSAEMSDLQANDLALDTIIESSSIIGKDEIINANIPTKNLKAERNIVQEFITNLTESTCNIDENYSEVRDENVMEVDSKSPGIDLNDIKMDENKNPILMVSYAMESKPTSQQIYPKAVSNLKAPEKPKIVPDIRLAQDKLRSASNEVIPKLKEDVPKKDKKESKISKKISMFNNAMAPKNWMKRSDDRTPTKIPSIQIVHPSNTGEEKVTLKNPSLNRVKEETLPVRKSSKIPAGCRQLSENEKQYFSGASATDFFFSGSNKVQRATSDVSEMHDVKKKFQAGMYSSKMKKKRGESSDIPEDVTDDRDDGFVKPTRTMSVRLPRKSNSFSLKELNVKVNFSAKGFKVQLDESAESLFALDQSFEQLYAENMHHSYC